MRAIIENQSGQRKLTEIIISSARQQHGGKKEDRFQLRDTTTECNVDPIGS